MEVIAPVPFWMRPKVSEIFWANIKHQRSRGLNIEVVAIVNDNANKRLAEQHTEHIIEHPNNVVGMRWNRGIEYCKDLDFNRMLILGSDDIFSKELIELYSKHKDPYIGLKDATAIDLYNKRFRYFRGYHRRDRIGESVGSGRYLSRDVLESVEFKPFRDINKSLDMSMTVKLKEQGYTNKLLTIGENPIRVGLKSKTGITKKFGAFNKYFDKDTLISYYGKEVVQLIYNFES